MISNILILFLIFHVASSYGNLLDNCIIPPLECPNKNITFWLYTRANPTNPHQLIIKEPATLKSAPWVKGAPIKLLIHGYTASKDMTPNTELRPAYMKRADYNLISVDYSPLAEAPCYIQAAQNAELVGKCTAQLVDELVMNHGFQLSSFHIIGFSLGGQITGFVANYLKSGTFDRITALDPALPLFVTTDNRKKIDSGDANFVDVLHTNVLGRGKLEASGDVDFFANGGSHQPGCPTGNESTSSCDHGRAPIYFAESITTDRGFYANRCISWIVYILNLCSLTNRNEDAILFGEYVSKNASGLYFFDTNARPPYSQGLKNKLKAIEY